MDELEDLLAQHASVTMNLGLKDHSVSRRDALLGQSLAERDRDEARNMTRRGDGVAPGEPWQCHCCAQDNVADAFRCRCCGRPASYGRPDASRPLALPDVVGAMRCACVGCGGRGSHACGHDGRRVQLRAWWHGCCCCYAWDVAGVLMPAILHSHYQMLLVCAYPPVCAC